MLPRIYTKEECTVLGRRATVVSGLGEYDLADTMECGQCFRHQRLVGNRGYTDSAADAENLRSLLNYEGARDGGESPEGYTEYLTVVGDRVVRVGQRTRGELIFFDLTPDGIDGEISNFFSLGKDFDAVREQIKRSTSSALLQRLADLSAGITLLTQNPWETVFSFIISQNNNIPRIRKIIRRLCAYYGENLSSRVGVCPLTGGAICEGKCRECGVCYSFPTKNAVLSDGGEGLMLAKVGFRYRYLMSLCELVDSGELDLSEIKSRRSLDYTKEQLKRVVGIGDKVASCAALFAFENYDAFPVDVWIKRALDTYFDGGLDLAELGEYAGIAQQYIFHGIRNLTK